MPISQLYKGAIIEDLKTNSIYEITDVILEPNNSVETFRYAVRTLVNPWGGSIKEIRITTVEQLSSLYFYNVETKPDGDSGLISFPITTMSEEDSEKLSNISIFIERYFSKARYFTKGRYSYYTKLLDVTTGIVRLSRRPNFFELFLGRTYIEKDITITELFENYLVSTDYKKSV